MYCIFCPSQCNIKEVFTTTMAIYVALGAAVRTLLTHVAFDIVALGAVDHTGVFVKQVLLLAAQTITRFFFTRSTSFSTAKAITAFRVTPVERHTKSGSCLVVHIIVHYIIHCLHITIHCT